MTVVSKEILECSFYILICFQRNRFRISQDKLFAVIKQRFRGRSIYAQNDRKKVIVFICIRSEKLGKKPAGSEVSVLELANDWLRLEDGGYILFEGGKFAEKL